LKIILKKNTIIPIGIGFAGFLLVVGISVLNFQNIGWLSNGDTLFNYAGWAIFRHGPWTNPVGLNPNYGLEFGSSIVYSDSIPLLAIFFKLFSRWLGEPFQYFGLWLLSCFILQATFGYKLADLLTQNTWLKFFIASIFVFTPVMLFRMNVHLALAGHFVLLWAIYLNLKKSTNWGSWALLIFIVLGIHFYLFSMVFALWFGSLLDRRISTRYLSNKSFALEAILIILVMFISAWQYGYFAISVGEASSLGYGSDPFNFVGFFNPLNWSLFIKDNIFTPPTTEGLAYLGGGAIGALVLGLAQLGRRNERLALFQKAHQYQFMLIAIILMLIIAISNNVDIGNSHYKFAINDHLRNILSIVRSSSRLSWPFQYLIIFISFWLIINGYRKGLVAIFVTLCVLQIVDSSKGWMKLHEYFLNLDGKNIEYSLTHEFWTQVPKQYSVIKIIPPQHLPDGWYNFAAFAAQNQMATNSVFLARYDSLKVLLAKEKTALEISSGKLDSKTIYVFQKWSNYLNKVDPKFDVNRDLFAKINGITFLAPNYKICTDCKQVDSALEINSLVPQLKIGEVVNFSKESKGADFLLEGWSHSDVWGTWSSGVASIIAVPMGDSSPSKIRLSYRGLVGPKHPISNVKVLVNGQYLNTIKITKQLNNSALIPIPKELRQDKFILLKFEYVNPTSPKDAGYGNQDDRLLTLGIESIQILK